MRLLFLVLIGTPGVLVAADWPHWRGPARTGITDEDFGWTGEAWLLEKPSWTAYVGEGASSPVVVGDRVYTLGWESGKDALRCLNAKNGTPVWSVNYKCPKYGRFHMGDEGHRMMVKAFIAGIEKLKWPCSEPGGTPHAAHPVRRRVAPRH